MAKKNQETGIEKGLRAEEISPLYGHVPELNRVLGRDVVSSENKDALWKFVRAYSQEFSSIYKNGYLDNLYITPNKSAKDKALRDLKELDELLIKQMLSTDEGYKLAEEAEKYGVKVNWNDTPLTVIKSKDHIELLAKKGYDFDAKRIVNGVETDFTDYNLANLSFLERNTIDLYEKMISKRKEFDKYEEGLRKYATEYNSPQTSAKRKDEILQYFNKIAPDYNKKQSGMRQECATVARSMDLYYRYAACLEAVSMDNQYVSQENIQKINPERLRESIRYMNGRNRVLKANEQKFTPRNATSAHETDGRPEGESLVYTITSVGNDLFGTLASAENSKAVYAKEAQVEKSGMSMTERLAQQTQGSTLENAENAMAFVGKDSQTNA